MYNFVFIFLICSPMAETKTKTKKSDAVSVDTAAIVTKYHQMIQFVKNTIHDVESDLKRVKIALQTLEKFDPSDLSSFDVVNQLDDEASAIALQSYVEEDVQVVE
jgi:Zn-dependent M16 (insulinase) family peptidase